jgi:hypothetical protein
MNQEIECVIDELLLDSLRENIIYDKMTSGNLGKKLFKEFHTWIESGDISANVSKILNHFHKRNEKSSLELLCKALKNDIMDGFEENGLKVDPVKVEKAVKLFLTKL